MRVLFLSHYFPPEVNAPASRTFDHCREWVRAGHDVTVLTCVPNHPNGRIFAGYRNRLYQTEDRDGIRIVRLLTYATANEGTLRRTANYVLYMLMAAAAAPLLHPPRCGGFDVAAVLQRACRLLRQPDAPRAMGPGDP